MHHICINLVVTRLGKKCKARKDRPVRVQFEANSQGHRTRFNVLAFGNKVVDMICSSDCHVFVAISKKSDRCARISVIRNEYLNDHLDSSSVLRMEERLWHDDK